MMAAYDYGLRGNSGGWGAEKGSYQCSLEQECQTNSGNYTHINGHADTMTAA